MQYLDAQATLHPGITAGQERGEYHAGHGRPGEQLLNQALLGGGLAVAIE